MFMFTKATTSSIQFGKNIIYSHGCFFLSSSSGLCSNKKFRCGVCGLWLKPSLTSPLLCHHPREFVCNENETLEIEWGLETNHGKAPAASFLSTGCHCPRGPLFTRVGRLGRALPPNQFPCPPECVGFVRCRSTKWSLLPLGQGCVSSECDVANSTSTRIVLCSISPCIVPAGFQNERRCRHSNCLGRSVHTW